MYSFDGVSCKEQLKVPPAMPRQRSKSDGLVKKTIGFAHVYSDIELDKTERFLEAEIRRESIRPPPEKKVARFRQKGELILHSKHVLLTVVILNLIDCALVLGELILDIHFIREFRTKADASSKLFIDTMQAKYPAHLHGHTINNMDLLYNQLNLAECQWPGEPAYVHREGSHGSPNHTNLHKREAHVLPPVSVHGETGGPTYNIDESTTNQTNAHDQLNHTEPSHGDHHGDHQHHHEHSIWEHVAHGMHKASITILGILFVENLCKLVCMGKAFLIKKLEVFDAIVVFVSFVVDLVLLKGLMEYRVQDAVFILTFLLPWRVIRVVNSLIVAVLDHEHFRLKMLYQEKKAVTAELKKLKAKEKGWDFHLKKIEHFCESEGIPKWKIRQHTAMGRKQSTITSMASLALNGILRGMILSPSDKLLLDKSLSLSTQDSSSLGIITESDDPDLTEVSRQTSKTSDSDVDFFYDTEEDVEKNEKDSFTLKIVENEKGGRQNVQADVESPPAHAHAYPEHSIMKNASKATIKSVTFEPKEKRPLLHRQDSFETKDRNSSLDNDESFKGWR